MSEISVEQESKVKNEWVKEQCKSKYHIIGTIIYSIICSLSILNAEIVYFLVFGVFIITLVKRLPRVFSSMIYGFILTTIASLIHPVLGGIISIIFIIIKFGNFFEKLRGIIAGIFIYGSPVCLASFLEPIFGDGYYIVDRIILILITFIIAFVIYNLVLINLYNNKYSAEEAIETMVAAPLIIILFVLPFIINSIDNFIDDIVDTGNDGVGSYEDFTSSFIDLNNDGINDEVHVVNGHFRGNTYVDSYIRTNPNSITSDNISANK